MLQQFPRKWCQRIVESRIEVEKARNHDEGYCGGSALPRRDPTKEKTEWFSNYHRQKKEAELCIDNFYIAISIK
jgi:hypothetical protein